MKKNYVIQIAVWFFVLIGLGACKPPAEQRGLVYFNDFESVKGWTPVFLTKKVAHSGMYSNKLDSAHVYGATFRQPFKDISDNKIVKVKASFWAYLLPKSHGKFVLDVKNKKDSVLWWMGKDIGDLITKTGEWQKGEITFVFPNDTITQPGNTVSVYHWNLGKEDFYIDDFRLEFVVGN